ncbi:pseudouridine synthase [Sphaerochaeta sp. PS]|uniref:pseudouridine synthase n=1 Tax=Sphaerochaeta sp. PS TaxID=3076336 RepID=UPI0028A536C1|nr:pseudouridine synthase [Sphaerochaeta sp. PS]MDT4762051.1 pseudouridine synthase [Sphaerochaeta sp. PS]
MEDALTLRVVHEEPSFLVVDKQANLPTVPLKDDPVEKQTLLSLIGDRYPEVLEVSGANVWEGGVLHRLDTATSGLVVVARTKEAYAFLQTIQKADLFWKEYRAQSTLYTPCTIVGFPEYPYEDPFAGKGKEVTIGSLFRRYGTNRREVRPVNAESPKHLLDKSTGTWYLTKVCYSGEGADGAKQFTCRLSSGFRHQVRAHLAWSGWPLDGDRVYHGLEKTNLSLRSVAVQLLHPVTQQQMEIRVDQ